MILAGFIGAFIGAALSLDEPNPTWRSIIGGAAIGYVCGYMLVGIALHLDPNAVPGDHFG